MVIKVAVDIQSKLSAYSATLLRYESSLARLDGRKSVCSDPCMVIIGAPLLSRPPVHVRQAYTRIHLRFEKFKTANKVINYHSCEVVGWPGYRVAVSKGVLGRESRSDSNWMLTTVNAFKAGANHAKYMRSMKLLIHTKLTEQTFHAFICEMDTSTLLGMRCHCRETIGYGVSEYLK